MGKGKKQRVSQRKDPALMRTLELRRTTELAYQDGYKKGILAQTQHMQRVVLPVVENANYCSNIINIILLLANLNDSATLKAFIANENIIHELSGAWGVVYGIRKDTLDANEGLAKLGLLVNEMILALSALMTENDSGGAIRSLASEEQIIAFYELQQQIRQETKEQGRRVGMYPEYEIIARRVRDGRKVKKSTLAVIDELQAEYELVPEKKRSELHNKVLEAIKTQKDKGNLELQKWANKLMDKYKKQAIEP